MRKLKKIILPILMCLILASQTGCSPTQKNEIPITENNNISPIIPNNGVGVKDNMLQTPAKTLATVYYMDVAQADCSIVITGDDVVVIDTGDVGTKDDVVDYLNNLGITKISYLVLTHPHADHIGGAPEIINTFDIDNILMPEITTTSKIFERTIDAIANNDYNITIPNRGDVYEIDNGSITILSDQTISWGDDLNSYSLVLVVTIGDVDFLFTGDAEQAVEEDIVKSGCLGSVDIYQVGHHGSYTATSQSLLETAQPKDAIISCGTDNSYGHPHSATVDKLNEYGVNYYRTDISGTIFAITDGITYTINTTPIKSDRSNVEETEVRYTESVELDTSIAINTSTYILNTSSKKIHIPSCEHVEKMSEKNKQEYTGDYQDLLKEGYTTCGSCM